MLLEVIGIIVIILIIGILIFLLKKKQIVPEDRSFAHKVLFEEDKADAKKAMSLLDKVRVVINSEGEAVDFYTAKKGYGITPDVVFIRGDRWALGAQNCHRNLAYGMWRDSWTHFYLVREQQLRSISEYSLENTKN